MPATLKAAWGEDSVGWRLFTLAASQQSYFRSSLLASRWHSLRVRTGLDGRAYAIGNERALLNMLEFAEQRAREHAHAAQVATGQVPLQSQLHYQTARGLRDGDPADKLDALAEHRQTPPATPSRPHARPQLAWGQDLPIHQAEII